MRPALLFEARATAKMVWPLRCMVPAQSALSLHAFALEALDDKGFDDAQEFEVFMLKVLQKLCLNTATMGMHMSLIASCLDYVSLGTLRMLVAGSALVVAKIINDEPVFTSDAADLLRLDRSKLGRAENFVCSVLFGNPSPITLALTLTLENFVCSVLFGITLP